MKTTILQPILALILAFAVTAAMGPKIITWLRKMKFGQKILEIGPKWHMNKQNIPTMGGFMFIIGIAVAILVVDIWQGAFSAHITLSGMTQYFAAPLLALAYGLVGFVDDHAKIRKKQNGGLTPLQKLILQIAVAAVFITLLRVAQVFAIQESGKIALWIPFTSIQLFLPWILYIIFAAFVIVGADNAVNLTDGIDGLAAGVTLPIAVFFTAVAFRQGNVGACVFAAALAGGLLGFLLYNFHPAKVFMGDTGSLFLGGAVVGLGFACDMPLILLPIGIVYIWETLSVILQVGCFKLTHGKRIFKMAPFHHHLEMCGWGEKKIVLVFTGITTVLCLIAWQGIALPA